jgi:hypothetical protein
VVILLWVLGIAGMKIHCSLETKIYKFTYSMLFNSINFAIFLLIVFKLYWFATKGNLKLQNILLLVLSYELFDSNCKKTPNKSTIKRLYIKLRKQSKKNYINENFFGT